MNKPNADRLSDGSARFGNWLTHAVEAIDQRYHSLDGRGTGAERAFGLSPGGLTVVAARSAFARHVALARIFALVSSDGETLLICNGSPIDLQGHLLAALSGISVQRLFSLDGQFMCDGDWPNLTRAVRALAEHTASLSVSCSSFDAIYAEMEARPHGSHVFIDNLHLVSGHESPMRLCRDLQAAARSLGHTVIVGAGLSHWVDVRFAKSSDRRTWPADLTEYCAGVEHIADRLVLVSEPESGHYEDGPIDTLVIDALSARGQRVLFHSLVPTISDEVDGSKDERKSTGEEADAQREASWRQRNEQENANRQEQLRRDATCTAIVRKYGEAFVEACNEAIRDSWQRMNPVWPNGPRKGQPREMPFLRLTDGKLWLFAGTGDAGRKIKTPVSRFGHGGLIHYWEHPAWTDGAVPSLIAVIERFSARDS
ncbi:hypothetical protein ACLKMY_21135 [Paraburkholderia mimosarum]|uniref:hypothetical protein n=1 Tax=Paraburkholderia mimosarum TaxID=312026 RepID=UPI0039C24ECD